MSYQNFILALELVKQCKGYIIAGQRTDEEIADAERMLQIQFSKQHREFLRRIGGLSFFGRTFGLYPDKKSSSVEGDSIAYAARDRKAYNLLTQLILIISFDDGYVAF